MTKEKRRDATTNALHPSEAERATGSASQSARGEPGHRGRPHGLNRRRTEAGGRWRDGRRHRQRSRQRNARGRQWCRWSRRRVKHAAEVRPHRHRATPPMPGTACRRWGRNRWRNRRQRGRKPRDITWHRMRRWRETHRPVRIDSAGRQAAHGSRSKDEQMNRFHGGGDHSGQASCPTSFPSLAACSRA